MKHRPEEAHSKPAIEAGPVGPDYLRLYSPRSAISSPSTEENVSGEPLGDASLQIEETIEKDPEAARIVREAKLHAAIAREGLEMVAAHNPNVNVNEIHKVIRDEQAHRVQKILGRLRHEH